jgi:ElaB/YqjD/DUF883 family membrane-anchored ribosome-binding protein
MGEDPGQVGAQRVGEEETKSPEQLRAEIEADRQELGDTVEALAAKTDVKTRAREKADELKRSAMDKKDELVSKAKQSKGEAGSPGGPAAGGPGGPGGPGGSSVVEQLKGTARQNPVQTAAVGAFLGGFMLGRLLGRR